LSFTGPLWHAALSQLAFGIICCSTFACLHETAHNTAFKSTALNQLAARLAGIAHLYPATAFRELHFTHHRYTHVPGKDPEISLGVNPVPPIVGSMPSYLSWLSGLPLLLFKIFMLVASAIGMPEFLRKRLYPFVRPEVRGALALEGAYILIIYAGVILAALYVHAGFWGLLTGQVLGHCLLASYLVPEHNGLPHEGDIFNRTRRVNTNTFVRWLMWNMPYHAEHHAYPAIPFHALPQLHELIKEEISHKDVGYPGFHLKVLKREIR
jgi:fatty acid desaturase